MDSKRIDSMKSKLAEWQTCIDECRVKANLAKLEAREKRDSFDHTYDNAKNKLSEWKLKANAETESVISALDAAWDALRDKYHEVKKKHADV